MEGQFDKNRLCGFARVIWGSGAYYIGWWRRNEMHGYGKYVLVDGTVKE